MKDKLTIGAGSLLGIETISMIEIESTVKIICQIIITAFTVYYLITKTNKHKNEKPN